jgi:hypothetical protein
MKNILKQNIFSWITIALSFFFTLCLVFVVYAWFSSLTKVWTWSWLTSTAWNQMVDNLDDLNSRVSNFSFNWWNVWIWSATPVAKLDVNGSLKVWGSETWVAASDIKAYIQKVACENRRWVWVDGVGCDEFAYYTNACTYTTCSCNTGYHMCTFPDLFSGWFNSLRRPWYNNPTSYSWIAGSYIGSAEWQSAMFYPGWGRNDWYIKCSAGSHFMVDTRRNTNGNTAWGCYIDSYTSSSAMCCKNNQ